MRKLIILFLAAGLFIACNNDKKTDRRADRDAERTKDDYSTDDKDSKDSKDADYKDADKGDKEEVSDRDKDNTAGGNWSRSDVNIFVDNCVSEAVKGGMQRTKATDYCECMQRKLEVLYPNSADVGNLDVESPNIKDMINKCLGL